MLKWAARMHTDLKIDARFVGKWLIVCCCRSASARRRPPFLMNIIPRSSLLPWKSVPPSALPPFRQHPSEHPHGLIVLLDILFAESEKWTMKSIKAPMRKALHQSPVHRDLFTWQIELVFFFTAVDPPLQPQNAKPWRQSTRF